LRFFDGGVDALVKKQGLNRTFLQCEDRMWRLGERHLLNGLQFDGGSDWFCLHHDFVEYIINSEDIYLSALKKFFKYTLLPSEVSSISKS
jgi:protein xylosyltransferase